MKNKITFSTAIHNSFKDYIKENLELINEFLPFEKVTIKVGDFRRTTDHKKIFFQCTIDGENVEIKVPLTKKNTLFKDGSQQILTFIYCLRVAYKCSLTKPRKVFTEKIKKKK